MIANRFDAFVSAWEPAFRATQACLVASWPAPEIRRLCDLAHDCLGRALCLAHDLSLTNLERQGFHDLSPPDPLPVLTPNLRGAIVRRINEVASAPTRRELVERLDIETRSALGLVGPDGVTPCFLADVLGRAAGDCRLLGEPPTARALRRMHPDTARLIVLETLQIELSPGADHGG